MWKTRAMIREIKIAVTEAAMIDERSGATIPPGYAPAPDGAH